MSRVSVVVLTWAVAGLGVGCSSGEQAAPPAAAASPQNELQGVWRVTEIVTTGPDAATFTAQPGLQIFTAGYYSITRVNTDGPRPDLRMDEVATASADALRAVYSPFTAQAGTYEMRAGTLILRPETAKNTYVMGSEATYSYAIDGATLSMTIVSSSIGPVEYPITWKLTRVE